MKAFKAKCQNNTIFESFNNKALKTFALIIMGSSFSISLLPNPSFAAGKRAEIVVDADTGNVLHEENATEKRYPASITKVMTLYMLFEAIDEGRISLDDSIVFSRNAARQSPTKLGVPVGGSISVETAILSLVIQSANDSAVAVAEKLAGSESEFAKQMTARARYLGMTNTNFVNASGLPNANQISTAEDLAKLAIAIRRDFPRQYHWFSKGNFTYNGRTMFNHNHLVGAVNGVDGLKTGFTSGSGYNLAATATRNGRRIVTVVMGGSSWRERDAKVETLIEEAYNSLGISNNYASNNDYKNYSLNDDDNADMAALTMGKTYAPVSSLTQTSFNRETNGFTWRTPTNLVLVANTKQSASDDNEEDGRTIVASNTQTKPNPEPSIAVPAPQNFANSFTLVINAEPVKEPIIFASASAEPENKSEAAAVENSAPTPPIAPILLASQPQDIEPVKQVSTETANNETIVANVSETKEETTVTKNTDASPLPIFSLAFANTTPTTQENLNIISSQSQIQTAQNNDEIEKLRQEAKEREEARLQLAINEEQEQIRKQRDEQKRALMAKREQERIAAEKQAILAEAKAKAERAIAAKEEHDRQLAQANKRGDTIVQIGAFKAKSDAQSTLVNFSKHFPSFANKEVSTFNNNGTVWFRARISGLALSAAESACRAVSRSGGQCSIIK